MSTPTSDQLGQNLDPQLRQFIKSYVDEQLKAINLRTSTEVEMSRTLRDNAYTRIGQLEAEVASLNSKLSIDNAYRITKAKIIQLCKELGI